MHVPVIVLAHAEVSGEDLRRIFFGFDLVALMRIPQTPNVGEIQNAGMSSARCIILFAGNAADSSMTDRRLVDGTGVITLAAIEGALQAVTTNNTHIVLELHRQESVKFMHRFPLYEDKYMDTTNWVYDPDENFTNHPRFASGGLFTASCLGALVAKSLYTPGMVELLEALVLGDDGSDAQTSFPFQVSLPSKYAGVTYGELVTAFLDENALTLGLYRKCFPGTGSTAGYVVTNPVPTTKLRSDDLVTVLAPSSFGQHAFEQGLLVGQQGQPGRSGEAKLVSLSEEAGGSKAARPGFEDPNDASLVGADKSVAEVIIPLEDQLPSMRDLQQERAMLQSKLGESLGRERALRAQLRACQFPLPQHLETPRSERGRSQLGSPGQLSNRGFR